MKLFMTHSFLQNKYTGWYFSLIEKRSKVIPDGYVEIHHIVPRSMGGSDEIINLVKLTPREHFICHLLLPKMVIGQDKYKMIYALKALMQLKDKHRNKMHSYKIGAKTYEILRHQFRTMPRSPETRLKMSLAKKGKPLNAAHRLALSKAGLGRKLSPEHNKKSHEAHIGMKRQAETRRKIKEKRALQVLPRKIWTLQAPSGKIIQTDYLKSFCQANRLGLSKLVETQRTKQPVDRGYSKGWQVLSTHRVT